LTVNELFAGVPVADLDAAVEWYERLLGGPADMSPNETEKAWSLTDEAWIYVVVDAERAGKGLLTVMVDDLDDRLDGMRGRGIAVGEVETIGPGVRKTEIIDPEGNRIGFGEAVSSAG
jgi:catechol 2,3-dioxygenase-like lactoylglutathione lyase family enzyme